MKYSIHAPEQRMSIAFLSQRTNPFFLFFIHPSTNSRNSSKNCTTSINCQNRADFRHSLQIAFRQFWRTRVYFRPEVVPFYILKIQNGRKSNPRAQICLLKRMSRRSLLDCRQNAMKVLEADREEVRRRNEPSGAAESLRGRTISKMGDRAYLESEEVKQIKEKKEQRQGLHFRCSLQKTRATGP